MPDRKPVLHYMAGGLEVIDILKAKLSPAEYKGFLRGNALKYLFRYDHKGTPLLDLEKARVYLGWLEKTVQDELCDAMRNTKRRK